MRLPCPFCGDRDAQEFVYRGDASVTRPSHDSDFHEYVYLRGNPAGVITEHWYHAQGCRQWLVVTRDTRSHGISGAVFAKDREA
ncbi:MAG: sarcosine oxidase subunit delta [Sphingomonas sp.]|uniref:sarcosine oxidase subunit delta n=1 Tax=Sphingomonas sp. TaxID=28214 RepID=UPI0035A84E14|nr:sarcosine oxidase subunit delta [Sphingomonas sp.]